MAATISEAVGLVAEKAQKEKQERQERAIAAQEQHQLEQEIRFAGQLEDGVELVCESAERVLTAAYAPVAVTVTPTIDCQWHEFGEDGFGYYAVCPVTFTLGTDVVEAELHVGITAGSWSLQVWGHYVHSPEVMAMLLEMGRDTVTELAELYSEFCDRVVFVSNGQRLRLTRTWHRTRVLDVNVDLDERLVRLQWMRDVVAALRGITSPQGRTPMGRRACATRSRKQLEALCPA